MDQKIIISALFEVYGGLLTQKQREIVELYYLCDLSLGEIADIKQISRQSVNDALKTAVRELESYESKLKVLQLKNQLIQFGKTLSENDCKRLTEIIEN